MTTLANRLAELRKAHRLSQEDLAAQVHVSRQAVSKWETGQASPDTKTLIALAEVYGISLDELVGLTVGERGNPAELSDQLTAPGLVRIHESDEGNRQTYADRTHYASAPAPADTILGTEAERSRAAFAAVSDPDSGYQVYDPRPNAGLPVAYGPADSPSPSGKGGWSMTSAIPIMNAAIAIIPFVYLALGFLFHAWSTAWVIFLVIPAIAVVRNSLKPKKRSPKERPRPRSAV